MFPGHLAHVGALWAPQFTVLTGSLIRETPFPLPLAGDWATRTTEGAVGPLGAGVGRVAPISACSPDL